MSIESQRKARKKYQENNIEKYKQSQRKYVKRNRKEINRKRNEYYWKNRDEQRKKQTIYQRKMYAETRELLLDKFGRECKCCKLNIPELLTLDHIKNNGAEERRKFKNNNIKLKQHVIKFGSKKDYRILCHNCNWAFANYGKCFH